MKLAVVTVLAGAMLLSASASAQRLELKFDALAAKASDKPSWTWTAAFSNL
jgi:hypothetical protein